MYTVFIIMSCKTILSTEVQGPSLTSERNAAMAPSTGVVLVRLLAIASLFFRFYATLHVMFQRLSCLPCVSYSSLASPVCSCVSESFMLTMRVLFFFLSPQCIFHFVAFYGTASSNASFSFQSKGMTTLTNRSPRVYH